MKKEPLKTRTGENNQNTLAAFAAAFAADAAVADAGGRASVTFVPGKNALLIARREGFARAFATTRGRPRADEGADVQFVMGRPHDVRGRVVDENGVGRRGLTVQLIADRTEGSPVYWPSRRITRTSEAFVRWDSAF